MNNVVVKRWLVAGGIGIVLLVIVSLLLHHTPPTPQSVNFQSGIVPSRTEDHTYLVATNRNFVAYNYETGVSSTKLKQDAIFPTISQVSWSPDEKKVAFEASGYVPGDTLAQILTLYGSDLSDNYWWVLDIASNTYTLLGVDVNNVSWYPDSSGFYFTHTYAESGDGDVYSYSLGDSGTKYLVSPSGLTSAQAVNGGFVAITNSGGSQQLTYYDKSQLKPHTISDGLVGNVAISPQGNAMTFIENNGQSEGQSPQYGKLLMASGNFSKPNISTVDKHTYLNAGWLPQGDGFFYLDGAGKITLESLPSNKLKHFSVRGLSDISLLKAFSETTAEVADKKSTYLVSLSSKQKVIDPLKGINALKTLTVTNSNYSISYYPESDTFIATIHKSPTEQYISQVNAYFKGQGVDPSLVNLIFDYDPGLPVSSPATPLSKFLLPN